MSTPLVILFSRGSNKTAPSQRGFTIAFGKNKFILKYLLTNYKNYAIIHMLKNTKLMGVLETMSGGSNNSELGFMDVLQIIFIVLKIVGVINWSWWAVFTPIWVSLAIVGVNLILMWTDF